MTDNKDDRPPRKNGRGPNGNGGMRFGARGLVGWFLFIALCAAIFFLLRMQGGTYTAVPLSDVMYQIREGGVTKITLEGDTVRAELKTATPFPAFSTGPVT